MSKLKLTTKEVLDIRAFAKTAPDTWRKGQALFNTLVEIYPEIAETVRGTENDPFHRDERINKFIEFITE